MYVWYLNSLCIGEIDQKETLEEFLIKEFNQVAKLVERGDCESYPIWSEWYENIMFDYEKIPENYIELDIFFCADKNDFTLKENWK